MKVKVKMRTTFADAEQTASPGDVIEVSIPQARELLAGGYAEPVGVTARSIMEGRPAALRETATAHAQEQRGEGGENEDESADDADKPGKPKPAGKKKSKIQPPQP